MHVPNLTEDEIAGLIDYAREKFAAERYPLAPALRPIREVLAKLDPTPKSEPLPPRKPYGPSLSRELINGSSRRETGPEIN